MCAKWFVCGSKYTVSCTVVLLRVNCGLGVLKSVTEVIVLIIVHQDDIAKGGCGSWITCRYDNNRKL